MDTEQKVFYISIKMTKKVLMEKKKLFTGDKNLELNIDGLVMFWDTREMYHSTHNWSLML